MNYRGGLGEGDIRPPYTGRPVAEVAGLVTSWSLPDASLGVAALNSVYNGPGRVAGWLNKPVDAVRSEAAFDELLESMTGKKVAVIGHFPGMKKMAERCTLTVLELPSRTSRSTRSPAGRSTGSTARRPSAASRGSAGSAPCSIPPSTSTI
jgi:hypothetical protein